jgi:hypothetical protein
MYNTVVSICHLNLANDANPTDCQLKRFLAIARDEFTSVQGLPDIICRAFYLKERNQFMKASCTTKR